MCARRVVYGYGGVTTRSDTLTVDDLTFAVRRSARRRTIAIAVGHDGSLSVAAPTRCSLRSIEEAVCTRLPWVRRKLAELGELPPPRQYATGERLPFLGRDCPLVVVGPDARLPVALRGDVLYLREEATREERRRRLGAWYARQARRRLTARVAHFAPLVGAEPARITVRDMRSRWGSCTAMGRVSFSWAIVALPPAIADYVVVHELAHLRELNHGPRFWRLVEAVLPDYKERRAWLRKEGRGFSV